MQRQGWKLLGIASPETVAAHSLRAAQIAYFLAKLEGYEHPEKIVTMLVFHDIGECRTGDIHKVANRYVTADERKAVSDQLHSFDTIGNAILALWDEMEEQKTTAGIIAKDADLLEMVVTAFELKRRHISGAKDWIEKTEKRLKTKTAKQLLNELNEETVDYWWKNLKKI